MKVVWYTRQVVVLQDNTYSAMFDEEDGDPIEQAKKADSIGTLDEDSDYSNTRYEETVLTGPAYDFKVVDEYG